MNFARVFSPTCMHRPTQNQHGLPEATLEKFANLNKAIRKGLDVRSLNLLSLLQL